VATHPWSPLPQPNRSFVASARAQWLKKPTAFGSYFGNCNANAVPSSRLRPGASRSCGVRRTQFANRFLPADLLGAGEGDSRRRAEGDTTRRSPSKAGGSWHRRKLRNQSSSLLLRTLEPARRKPVAPQRRPLVRRGRASLHDANRRLRSDVLAGQKLIERRRSKQRPRGRDKSFERRSTVALKCVESSGPGVALQCPQNARERCSA
jgi:hypothetical protein